jgi:peptidyl-prolyl cis-trans isomerase B (cyclophilin B)
VKRFFSLALAGLLLGASWSLAADKNPVVVIDTSLGTIKVELDPVKAPITVKNFLDYVDAKFYDGTLIHRVKPNFVIQGGGLEPGLKEKKTREPIKNEAGNGLSNEQYTIAMAREPEPDTATAQFYINLVDNSKKLDKATEPKGIGYCVFGKVIEGKDVVEKIAGVATETRDDSKDVPVKDVVIKSIRRADK